jgi:uncharacterized protein YdiU (UPF0061 family)
VEWEGHQGTDLPFQELVEQHQCSGHHLQTGQEGQHLGNLQLPSQTEINRWMERLNLIRRTNLTLQLNQSKKHSNPRLTNRNREIQEMMVDNLLQTDPGLQLPTGWDLLFHPTSKKPERMIEEHMKQEKSQVIQHMQDSGIGLMW